MNDLLPPTIGLLLAAVIVAQIARRLALPYTVGLVIAGIAMALLRVDVGFVLSHDLIFDIILPPLLFEAAINIRWVELRRDLLPVLTLAILGTLIASAVIALGMVYVLGWTAAPAIVFGVLIAATDPVAVIALFKDNRIVGRMRLLVESESLFNDGVAAVLFAVVLAWTQMGDQAGGFAALDVGRMLTVAIGGGILAGLLVGAAAALLAGRITDELVEGALTFVAAYGSFLLAERFHASGVLAAVMAGLVIGNLRAARAPSEPASGAGHDTVLALWEFIAFIANSFVFLLIGVATAGIDFHDLGIMSLMGVVLLVLVSRAITVYPLCLLFVGSRRAIPLREQHVLWWGGLRGALGLALALALPASLARRDEILIAAFAVVAFSVIAQGVTMPLLLRSLGFSRSRR